MRQLLHDIRNFVGAIVGSLSLAQASTMTEDKRLSLVSNAFKSAVDLKAFVDRSVAEQDKGQPFPRRRITDGHASLKDLNDRNGLFLAAIEKTRMPMIVTDPHQPDNPIIFANEAFVNTSGYDLNELIGTNCRFLQGPDTDPEVVQKIREAIKDQTDIAIEILNYRKDGSAFWNALFISPIFDPEGKLLYFFGSQLDITRRREAEQAMRKGQKMEAIGQLTGGIAHDFNNLLQIVLGNLTIARETDDLENSNRHLDAVFQAATKARNLTQQLLAFSRKQPLAAKVTNLNRVILDTRDMLSRTLGELITVDTKLTKAIKNVNVDTVQLEMALVNVLVNARDAMPNGGNVTITTTSWTVDEISAAHPEMLPGDYVKLVVTDNGAGMPPDILAHATEPFFTTKDIGKGTGLGLAQAYGFVRQSKGHLAIDSEEGRGTSVSFIFPVVESPDETASPPGLHTKLEGRGERIRVVEDNREVQELARHILEHEGYKVETASNAEEAMRKIAEPDPFAMIFSDIMMPGGLNGIELVKRAHVKQPSCAILLTTGYSDDAAPTGEDGQFETIYKPYMPAELTQKVRQVLNRRRDHRG